MRYVPAFSAPHAQAAQVGMEILREGGNALDAMIAAASAMTVLYPHMNSLAGDSFWLIHKPGEAPCAIDACGAAAQLASIDWYQQQGHAQIPGRGHLACVTPGATLSGYQRARELAQQWSLAEALPLSHLLAPAIALARDGIRVTRSLQQTSAKLLAEDAGNAAFRQLFTPRQQALCEGDYLCNPDLANTLELLAAKGLHAIFNGDLATHTADYLSHAGSPLRLGDLQQTRAQFVTPLSVQTRVGQCYNLPAPTQGVASLMILALYDRLYQSDWSDVERVHALIECTKQAFLVRDAQVADPRRLSAQWPQLLTDDYLDALATQIAAQALPWPHIAQPGDTVWMGCVDQQGVMVSFIQSIYWEFGAAVVIPATGLVWNNRGVSFQLDAQARNALLPGMKPFHTLNPALALLQDGRRMVYGTMGGEGQPQTQSALFTRYLYDGVPLADAIARGRWLLGRTWGDQQQDLKLEQDLFEQVGDALRARGHQLRAVPLHSELMGHAGAVVSSRDGSADAVSDPRSDGAGVVEHTHE